MGAKTSQLQIRVSPAQKALLREAAERAGVSISAYVLDSALPTRPDDVLSAVDRIADRRTRPEALADLMRSLSTLAEADLTEALGSIDPSGRVPLVKNCLAAVVEHVCRERGLAEPAWVSEVEPLERPHFAWELRSLRPYLMRASLPSFKRRRLYVPVPYGDASVGGR